MGSSLRAAALLAFVVLSVLVSLLIGSVQQFGARVSRPSNASFPEDDEFVSRRRALDRQLQRRRAEIVPLLPADARLVSKRGRAQEPGAGEMGCGSLVDMRAVEVLGSGYTKLVVKVNLSGGQPVALKLVNEQGIDMGRCVEDFRDPDGCRELVSYKLRKEMLLLQRLRHPNVIQVRTPPPDLGTCPSCLCPDP